MGKRPASRRRRRGHGGGGAGQGRDGLRASKVPNPVPIAEDHAASGDLPGPPCAICRHKGRGPSRLQFLTHGVHLWLCASHGSAEFMRREGGGEFVQRLTMIWVAGGGLGFRRRAALTAHIERLRLAGDGRDKPGSHTWPKLRREAEQRFAAGEPPAFVIDELRGSYRDGPAIVPSVRTMRRWFAQGRWLIPFTPARRLRPRSIPPQPHDLTETPAPIPGDAASSKRTPRRE